MSREIFPRRADPGEASSGHSQGIEGLVSVDPEGKHFHDTIWATALSGAAGTGLYWWWHNYIEPYNLYRHYAPLAKLLRGVDLPAHEWKAPALSRPNLPVSLKVYGLIAARIALFFGFMIRWLGGSLIRNPCWDRTSQARARM